MDRRTFLAASTVAASMTVAGCSESLDVGSSDDDSDDDETEDGSDDDGSDGEDGGFESPAWTEWVPADTFADGSDADIISMDVDEVREKFPQQEYEEFSIGQMAEVFSLDEEQFNNFTLVTRDSGPEPAVLLGDFTKEETLGVLESQSPDIETEEYNGVTIADDSFGFADGALLFGEEFRRLVDARFGDTDSLAEDSEEWPAFYGGVDQWDFFIAADGYYGDSFEYELSKSGITIDVTGENSADFTMYFLFDSADTGETAMEEFGEEGEEVDGMTLQEKSLDGRLMTVTLETEGVSAILDDPTVNI